MNAQNKETLWTPLHAATFQEHGKVYASKLTSIGKYNLQNTVFGTKLVSLQIVMLLLERNAQPELPDSDGR